MARKILQAHIKTVDDNNHIRIWNETEVEITFLEDRQEREEKPLHIPQPIPKRSITKKIKKIIVKKE